jgi:uncharacterized protein (DUF302 family)
MDVEGLITQPSRRSARETIDRLAVELEAKGVTIFARIDHAAGAVAVGMRLRPTELLIFGNAKAGTPLMQLSQAIGIDLPLKALAWEDAAGKVRLAYNDPAWLARRHGLAGDGAPVQAMAALLAGLAKTASS